MEVLNNMHACTRGSSRSVRTNMIWEGGGILRVPSD